MRMNEKMLNRQLGRNAQEFAQAIGRMETPAVRYPYLRELLAVIEEARPEWAEAAHKADLSKSKNVTAGKTSIAKRPTQPIA